MQIYVYVAPCHHHHQRHAYHDLDFDFAIETRKKGTVPETVGLSKVRPQDDAVKERDRESSHHSNRILILSHHVG